MIYILGLDLQTMYLQYFVLEVHECAQTELYLKPHQNPKIAPQAEIQVLPKLGE